jgi:phospholipid/cholesterol/gamma-HCH transport system substrate-binding protein
MKITRTMEIGVGLFVSAGIAALTMLAMKVANLNSVDIAQAYSVRAYFDNVGGLQVRAPVKMGGVLVGRVARIGYDAARFQAEVELRIDPAFDHIPTDTAANVYTAGLLGEQYISLEPGGAETFLQAGAEIEVTQSALILERTLQEFIYAKTAKSEAPTP